MLDGKDDKRVIIGSANFTEQAFSQRKQYEELLVFDNSPILDIYHQRFHDIYDETVDFVPEKFKQNFLGEPINIAELDQLFDVLMEEAKGGKIFTEFTEAQTEELNEATHQADLNSEQLKKGK